MAPQTTSYLQACGSTMECHLLISCYSFLQAYDYSFIAFLCFMGSSSVQLVEFYPSIFLAFHCLMYIHPCTYVSSSIHMLLSIEHNASKPKFLSL